MEPTQTQLSADDDVPTATTLPDADAPVLITMGFCPYAHRVHLVLNALHVQHHTIDVHLKQKPEWFNDSIYSGNVPALGLTELPGMPFIYESLHVADYLDEKYGAAGERRRRPLHPVDPVRKALDRLCLERWSNNIVAPFVRFVLVNAAARPQLDAGVLDLEAELKARGTRFLCGNEAPGMLDYMIWPWIERLPALRLWTGEAKYQLPGRMARLQQYEADMRRDEAVQKSYSTPEEHYRFLCSEIMDAPDMNNMFLMRM